MALPSTANLSLKQWDDADNFDPAQVNANFKTLDDVVPAFACTSTTRPTTNRFRGRVIYETDTDKYYMWDGAAWVPYFNLYRQDTLTFKNNFTYASAVGDTPVATKSYRTINVTGRIRQTAGFTGGVAFTVADDMAPISQQWPMPVYSINSGNVQGPRIVAQVSLTGDVTFSLADGSAQPTTWGSGTWISFSLNWISK